MDNLDQGACLAAPGSREPSSAVSALTGFDPSREHMSIFDGVAWVVPKMEPFPALVYRVGRFAFAVLLRWDAWGIGIQILRGGPGIQIGPAMFAFVHVERQLRDSDGSPKGGDACGSVHDSAGPKDIAQPQSPNA